jgi:hypothetical protein
MTQCVPERTLQDTFENVFICHRRPPITARLHFE